MLKVIPVKFDLPNDLEPQWINPKFVVSAERRADRTTILLVTGERLDIDEEVEQFVARVAAHLA
jgi:uncharacterized protein YlzI (FlbEa/FlbD family)